MATRGMTQATIDEGWALFTIAAGAKLRYLAATGGMFSSAEEAALLAALDRWENTWFPTVGATLKRHFPKVHAEVFLNLSQTEGKAVVVSVGTLLDRLAEQAKKSDEGKAAVALLEARGLTADAKKPAEEILAKFRVVGESAVAEVEPVTKKEQEEAQAEVWDWYLEWSIIARTLFTRGDQLIRMGLREMRRGGGEEEEEEGEEKKDDEEPANPADATKPRKDEDK
jgi:hypothetical protein